MVGEDGTIVTLGGFVQFNGEVLDSRCFELLGHAPLHIARGLAHLELALVCGIGNGVGVDAGAGFGFGGRMSSTVGLLIGTIVQAECPYLGFNVDLFFRRDSVLLI